MTKHFNARPLRKGKRFRIGQLLHAPPARPIRGYDTPLTRGTWSVQVLHKNEKVYYAFVKSSRFGANRWSYKLNVRVFGAGRF